MDKNIENALEVVNALLAFQDAVEEEIEQKFPGLKSKFSLVVDSVNKQAAVEVKFDTPGEDLKTAVSEYVDENMARWCADLNEKGAGLTNPSLRIR